MTKDQFRQHCKTAHGTDRYADVLWQCCVDLDELERIIERDGARVALPCYVACMLRYDLPLALGVELDRIKQLENQP